MGRTTNVIVARLGAVEAFVTTGDASVRRGRRMSVSGRRPQGRDAAQGIHTMRRRRAVLRLGRKCLTGRSELVSISLRLTFVESARREGPSARTPTQALGRAQGSRQGSTQDAHRPHRRASAGRPVPPGKADTAGARRYHSPSRPPR